MKKRVIAKRKLCFVICYFGKLPNTMQITLDTCMYNQDYDWLLFTDDKTKFNYPDNFHVVYCSFQELKDKIQSKFDFNIYINKPYKLCDFKPAYGYIFEDELVGYEYWGYCDLDQYFGDLSNYLTDDFLRKYDKIFTLGHMTIFPNNDISRMMFTQDTQYLSGCYQEIYSNAGAFLFDEWPPSGKSINAIAEFNKLSICGQWPMLDVAPHNSLYIGSEYDIDKHIWVKDENGSTIAVWDDGKLYAYSIINGLIKREILYIHIQKRKQTVSIVGENSTFFFFPNKIIIGEEQKIDAVKKMLKRAERRNILQIDERMWKWKLFKEKQRERFIRIKSLTKNLI